MPYLGSTPNASFSSRTKQDFTANGSTTAFTLSSAVASANDIEVFVGNVRQEPTDAYTVNGTALTMSAAPANGLNFYVVFKGLEENSIVPADNTISSGKIASGAITTAKIADDAVTSAKLDTNLAVAGNLTVAGTFDSPSVWKLVDTQSGSSTSPSTVQLGTLSTSYKKHKIFYRFRFTEGGSSDTNTVYHHWGSGSTLRGGYTELGLSGTFANPVGHNGGYAHLGRAVASGSSGYDLSGEMLITQSHSSGTYKAYLHGHNVHIRTGTGPVTAMHSHLEGLTSFTSFNINSDESAGSGVAFTYDVEIYGWN